MLLIIKTQPFETELIKSSVVSARGNEQKQKQNKNAREI